LGFRVWGLWCGVRVLELWFVVWGLRVRVWGLGFGDEGFEFGQPGNSPLGGLPGSRRGQILGGKVTKFAPDKTSKLILQSKLTFDERSVVHRVAPASV
jgi:hypothetical protein